MAPIAPATSTPGDPLEGAPTTLASSSRPIPAIVRASAMRIVSNERRTASQTAARRSALAIDGANRYARTTVPGIPTAPNNAPIGGEMMNPIAAMSDAQPNGGQRPEPGDVGIEDRSLGRRIGEGDVVHLDVLPCYSDIASYERINTLLSSRTSSMAVRARTARTALPPRHDRAEREPSKTAEQIRLELAEAWGDMGAAWGVTPAIARVQAYLDGPPGAADRT